MPGVCLILPVPSSPSQVRRRSAAAIAGFSAARRASVFTFGGERRLLLGQLLQRRDARLAARLLELVTDLRQAPLVLLEIGGRDVGDGLDRLDRVGALLIVARVLFVLHEARAQHRQRRRNAVELEVILGPGLQRLTVLVQLVVGQPQEDAAVAVGQRLVVRRPLLREDERRPVVGEIDQRVARAFRGLGVDPALFRVAGLTRHQQRASFGRQLGMGLLRLRLGDGGARSARPGARRRAGSGRGRRCGRGRARIA